MLTRLISKAASARAFTLLALAVAAGALVASGCGSSGAKSANASNSSAAGGLENVSMEVLNGERAAKSGHLGPDGKGHDMFLPSDLHVKVGDKVTVTVTNYDEGPHTFTVPDLGVNATVAPATNADKGIPSKTTFTFVARRAGTFRWYCMLPCDKKANGWAMSQSGSGPGQDKYMAGYVVAA